MGANTYPDNALLLTMVAETYLKLGRHREASELLSDAIEKDPGFSTARWRLGTLLVMQGRQGGLEQLEKAVELEPFSPGCTRNWRGSTCRCGRPGLQGSTWTRPNSSILSMWD